VNPVIESLLEIVEKDPYPAGYTSSYWQDRRHSSQFDSRHVLDNRNLARAYEAFNDVRLLNERVDPFRKINLLEVGCATGELRRYLRIKYPKVKYYGIDVSQPAIQRAKEKYPKANYFVNQPDVKISDTLEELRIPAKPETGSFPRTAICVRLELLKPQ
jgi:2-polyprenyl-3-methyl-5-hydroxy-6-metoxy-1,4-benzoquinol methylase